MAVFNATSQFWFHYMLIMYVVEFMEVSPFSSKSCKISSQKPTICMLTAKKQTNHSKKNGLSFLEWSGAAYG